MRFILAALTILLVSCASVPPKYGVTALVTEPAAVQPGGTVELHFSYSQAGDTDNVPVVCFSCTAGTLYSIPGGSVHGGGLPSAAELDALVDNAETPPAYVRGQTISHLIDRDFFWVAPATAGPQTISASCGFVPGTGLSDAAVVVQVR